MEDIKQIQEFFSKPLNEEKEPLDIIDLAKVVKAVQQTGHPVTVLLVPKFNEIEVLTGMNAPDDMLRDLSNAVDSLGYGRDDIIIAGDSSNLSRREYSDIRRVNGGAKDYLEESVNEFKVGQKVTYLGHPAVVTATKEYNGRNFVSVSYDKGTGKTKASDILATSGDVKAYFEESYASSFGGFSKKLDGRKIEIELKKRGYDTPNTGIWNRILVTKDGKRVGMINTDESSYMKDGKMYKWEGTSDFISHVESVNEMDMNDPILMKMRADKFAGSDPKAGSTIKGTGFDWEKKTAKKEMSPAKAKKLAFLKKERAQLMRDMEQEAEPEGGPIADEYGSKLNRIDAAIAKLSGRKEMTYDQAIAEGKGKMPTQDQVDRFFELTQNETHYLNSKPVAGQEATFNLMKVEPWDEYDLSNWNALVRKAKQRGKSIDEELKKGDVVKFKNGREIYILGPKGDGYDYKDGREKGHHPKGWFDMMISSGKATIKESKYEEEESIQQTIDRLKARLDDPNDGMNVPFIVQKIKRLEQQLDFHTQLDQVDFAKVVKAVEQTGHPVTVLLVPKFNEIEVITGMNAPDDMLRDLSNAVDSLGYGRNDIIIAGDSSNLSRREYSDIRRVNGGAKDYFEESVNEDKKLTYNDFVQMVRDDMRAGAASDENASENQIERVARWKYDDYLKGISVDDLFEASKEEENEFHKELDKLVHKTFGHSSDEKKKMNEASKGALNYFNDLKYYYQKAFRYLDVEEREEYKQLAKDFFSNLQIDDKVRAVGLEEVVSKVISKIKEDRPGLWANIHAQRERGEKPARKGSKDYKAAVKAGKEINKKK